MVPHSQTTRYASGGLPECLCSCSDNNIVVCNIERVKIWAMSYIFQFPYLQVIQHAVQLRAMLNSPLYFQVTNPL